MSFSCVTIGIIKRNIDGEPIVVDAKRKMHDQLNDSLHQVLANSEEGTKVIAVISTDELLIDWVERGREGKASADIMPVQWIENLGFRIRCPTCTHLIEPSISPYTRELVNGDMPVRSTKGKFTIDTPYLERNGYRINQYLGTINFDDDKIVETAIDASNDIATILKDDQYLDYEYAELLYKMMIWQDGNYEMGGPEGNPYPHNWVRLEESLRDFLRTMGRLD